MNDTHITKQQKVSKQLLRLVMATPYQAVYENVLERVEFVSIGGISEIK